MSEWISVKDRVPDDYVEVFYIALNENGSKERMTGHRENGRWTHCCLWYSTIHLNDEIKVTHWMPLPEPPVMESDKDE